MDESVLFGIKLGRGKNTHPPQKTLSIAKQNNLNLTDIQLTKN